MTRSDSPLCLVWLQHSLQLTPYLEGLVGLVKPWRSVLEVDNHPPLDDPIVLMESLTQMIPHCGLLHDDHGLVVAAVGLTDVKPGRFGFIHGVRNVAFRRHRGIKVLAQVALDYAFNTLNLAVVYARFESDNIGAIGFCRQNGFVRLADLPQAVVQGGVVKDQVLYGLFRQKYLARFGAIGAGPPPQP